MSLNLGISSGKGIAITFTYQFPDKYLKIVNESDKIISPERIKQIIAHALGQGWKEARSNAPVDTGFLRDHIFVYMTTNYEGWLSSDADYSAAVERGYQGRGGKWVGGKHFMIPAINTAKKIFFDDMKITIQAFAKGEQSRIRAAGIQIKSGSPSVAKKPTRTGFAKQRTVTKKPRRYYFSQVSTTQFRDVQRFGLGRFFPRKRIGGR